MVSTSTPYATLAAVRVLEEGGNAVDAAASACFSLMVTDPAMTSLGGRSQTLIRLADGRIIGVDGATQAPVSVTALHGPRDRRSGYQVVPIPGNPAALAHIVENYGRLPLRRVLAPAIELAAKGFPVTPRLAEIWESESKRLAANPGAAQNYLKPDGSAYRSAETFRHPRLAALLEELASSGPDLFYRGWIAEKLVADVRAGGGFLDRSDLARYRPEEATVVRTSYRGHTVLSLGRHAWGNTLVEMLNILGHFRLGRGPASPREVELIARTIAQALEDRPQALGTLRPKPNGIPLERLSSPDFGRERASRIRSRMGKRAGASVEKGSLENHDTTHLSVIDQEGNAVAMTTSIGPRFGSGVATSDLGFLYAHSYNMRSTPTPEARDLTEMTPTIVLHGDKPVLAVGAAGSERIPGAILQVIVNVIDKGYPVARAVAAPRVFAVGRTVRLHQGYPPEIGKHFRDLGFAVELRDATIHQHLGIVQAVQFDPKRALFSGAADPVYDGASAGPAALTSRGK